MLVLAADLSWKQLGRASARTMSGRCDRLAHDFDPSAPRLGTPPTLAACNPSSVRPNGVDVAASKHPYGEILPLLWRFEFESVLLCYADTAVRRWICTMAANRRRLATATSSRICFRSSGRKDSIYPRGRAACQGLGVGITIPIVDFRHFPDGQKMCGCVFVCGGTNRFNSRLLLATVKRPAALCTFISPL
jgi:hypothetical protein